VRNLVCADGEFDISFHPSGFAGGYAQLAINAHRVRAGEVEVVVADLADVIRSKEFAGRPQDLRVLPLLYRHLSGRRAGARSRTGMTRSSPRLLPTMRECRPSWRFPAGRREAVQPVLCVLAPEPGWPRRIEPELDHQTVRANRRALPGIRGHHEGPK
jgi:hypothetical protein